MHATFPRISFIAIAALLLTVGVAAAQQAPTEAVVVMAPYLVKKQTVESRPGRMQVFSITVERPVSYSGLNLSKDADVGEFEKRIRDAARDVCAQADRMYHQYVPITSSRECVISATRDGLAKMEDVIAATATG